MSKCRLNLGKVDNSDYAAEMIILCKKIHTIIIDGETFHKNDCNSDSKLIQTMYKHFCKNSNKVTYIKYGDFVGDVFTEYTEVYLQNGKLHNCADFAVIKSNITLLNTNNIVYNRYFLEGDNIHDNEWLKHPKRISFMRSSKLERILKI